MSGRCERLKGVFAVCSGSGGVGKSTLALALALGAAAAGRETILLDASGVSRACDLMLGLESAVALDLVDVSSGQASIEHALYAVPQQSRLRFCCASLDAPVPLAELSGAVLALRSLCDALVIDLPTGQAATEPGLLGDGDVRVVVTRPDDASLRAAERVMGFAAGDRAARHVVVNRYSRGQEKRARQYPRETVQAILDAPVFACIPEDEEMAAQVGKGRARPLLFGGAARAALDQMVKNLLRETE